MRCVGCSTMTFGAVACFACEVMFLDPDPLPEMEAETSEEFNEEDIPF